MTWLHVHPKHLELLQLVLLVPKLPPLTTWKPTTSGQPMGVTSEKCGEGAEQRSHKCKKGDRARTTLRPASPLFFFSALFVCTRTPHPTHYRHKGTSQTEILVRGRKECELQAALSELTNTAME